MYSRFILCVLLFVACSEERATIHPPFEVKASYTLALGTVPWDELVSSIVVADSSPYISQSADIRNFSEDLDTVSDDPSGQQYQTNVVLVVFGEPMTSIRAADALEELGYGTGTIEELLTLHWVYGLPQTYTVIAPGTSVEYVCPSYELWLFPQLTHRHGEWQLRFRPETQVWPPGTLFLAQEQG